MPKEGEASSRHAGPHDHTNAGSIRYISPVPSAVPRNRDLRVTHYGQIFKEFDIMSSALNVMSKGQGRRLTWKPIITVSSEALSIFLPSSFLVINNDTCLNPRTHPCEHPILRGLDSSLFLGSGEAREEIRTAVLAVIRDGIRNGNSAVLNHASARWSLQAAIEQKIDSVFQELERGVQQQPGMMGLELEYSREQCLTSEGGLVAINVAHSPHMKWPHQEPLSQYTGLMPPGALFKRTLSIVPDSSTSPLRVRYTMPSLVGIDPGVGSLIGEIKQGLLEQMARSSVVLLRRLYHHSAAQAKSQPMDHWLQSEGGKASDCIGYRIGALLGQAKASEITVLPQDVDISGLVTKRATWPLLSANDPGRFLADQTGPVFEIIAGPVMSAIDAIQSSTLHIVVDDLLLDDVDGV